MIRLVLLLLVLVPSLDAVAAPMLPALVVTPGDGGQQTYSISIQVLLLMTALTLLPAAVLMMTSFTRIIIVLAILRQAMGTMQSPSNQILIGLSLFLTLFVMVPVFDKVYDQALVPYFNEQLAPQEALAKAARPFREFMLGQTRESDIAQFARIAGREGFKSAEEVPFTILLPSFVTSELKTAFQIGFLIFIPFLIIDIVVASVLMSMGMMMLSPMLISLPFKIMLFVVVDGWSLIMGTLAASFYVT